MKIAILSLRSRFGDVTGDCMQAEKTAEALREIGEDAHRFYLDASFGNVYGEANELLGEWRDVMGEMDVIHTLPPIPSPILSCLPKVKALLATSTVFWSSPTYWKVVSKNSDRFDTNLLKGHVREIAAKFGLRLLNAKKGYDLLLANSEDEIRCVKKYCRLKPGAKLYAVPNAIDPIPRWVADLPRLEGLPQEDYVIVPGFFAARKNQRTLINALRNGEHPIVFMGKGPLFGKCRKIASRNMIFLGHVEHQSRLFYSALKYARVACLPSNCETPGIAALEAAALGARPVIPYEGGTCQYYGWDAEYLNPLSESSIRTAVENAWLKGRLSEVASQRFANLTWKQCAIATKKIYVELLGGGVVFSTLISSRRLEEAA